MPNTPRAQRSWDQLSSPLRRSLLWLNAGTLLRVRDLLDLAWPAAQRDRRNTAKRLREWAADQRSRALSASTSWLNQAYD